jgi:hypothetical protein
VEDSLVEAPEAYVSHDHPKLRNKPFSLVKSGPGGQEIYLGSLKDLDLEVQKRAVWCLGMIKSPPGIERMLEILDQLFAAPSPQSEQLETQIYHALGISGNMAIGGRVEQIH